MTNENDKKNDKNKVGADIWHNSSFLYIKRYISKFEKEIKSCCCLFHTFMHPHHVSFNEASVRKARGISGI